MSRDAGKKLLRLREARTVPHSCACVRVRACVHVRAHACRTGMCPEGKQADGMTFQSLVRLTPLLPRLWASIPLNFRPSLLWVEDPKTAGRPAFAQP